MVKIVVGISLIYLTYSLIYHYRDKSLTFETVLEYILMAGLVLVILLGVTI